MALIVPGSPGWGYMTGTLSGTPSASPGIAITAGTSNANGTTVTLFSAIAHDVEYLIIGGGNFSTAAADNSTHIDIMYDPAGGTTWGSTPLIADLLMGGISGVVNNTQTYHFPIWLKAGTSIGARARTAHTVAAGTSRIHATAYGESRNPAQWWCGQTVTAIGTTAASSSGQAHTSGNTGAYSSWTSLGSTTASHAGAISYGVQTQLTTHALRQYYFQFGAGSTQIGPTLWAQPNTSEACTSFGHTLTFCSIPSGTQLQVRGTCSGTAEALDVAAYITS